MQIPSEPQGVADLKCCMRMCACTAIKAVQQRQMPLEIPTLKDLSTTSLDA